MFTIKVPRRQLAMASEPRCSNSGAISFDLLSPEGGHSAVQ
jgi:hypothetical protein